MHGTTVKITKSDFLLLSTGSQLSLQLPSLVSFLLPVSFTKLIGKQLAVV
jgi:hypothetical protein